MNCQLTSVRLFGLIRQESRSLSSVTAVRIVDEFSENDYGLVFLESRSGSIYLSNSLAQGHKVDAFLKSPTKEPFKSLAIDTLLLVADMGEVLHGLSGFVIFGLMFVFPAILELTQVRLYIFDKRKQKLTVDLSGWLQRTTNEGKFSTSSVELKLKKIARNHNNFCYEVELKLPREKDDNLQKDRILHVTSEEREPARAAYARVRSLLGLKKKRRNPPESSRMQKPDFRNKNSGDRR